jgi:single-strand DNA-binding protein
MKMIGLARLGRDVEVRYLQDQNQTPVANLALAYDYGQKDGEGKRASQWVEGTLWGPRAEALAPYLVKGQQLEVFLDDVHVETYERNDNTEGVKLVGRVMSLDFGARPQGGDGGQQQQRGGGQRQQGGQQRQQQGGQRQQATHQQYAQQSRGGRPAHPASSAGGGGAPRGGGFDEMDDDIPFGPAFARAAWSAI